MKCEWMGMKKEKEKKAMMMTGKVLAHYQDRKEQCALSLGSKRTTANSMQSCLDTHDR